MILIYIYMWEPKMCRLAWQLLGMLGNVFDRPRHALQRPRHALQRPRRPRHAFFLYFIIKIMFNFKCIYMYA